MEQSEFKHTLTPISPIVLFAIMFSASSALIEIELNLTLYIPDYKLFVGDI